jgi:capsular exopolysaccharide synthesis family protein
VWPQLHPIGTVDDVYLSDYLRAVRKRWWVVVGAVVLGVLVAGGLLVTATPVYQSKVTFYVSLSTDGDTSGSPFAANQFAQQRATSYAELLSSDKVGDLVRTDTGLDLTPSQIARTITGTVQANTVLLTATVADSNKNQALTIASSVGDVFPRLVTELDAQVSSDGSVSLTVVTGPTTPGKVSPRPSIYVGLGFLVGLALGLFAAIIRQRLDTTVRSDEDLEAVSPLPILGSIPEDNTARTSPLVWGQRTTSPRAEVYRRLRTNLEFVDVDHSPQVIVLTSSLPAEGKSVTSANVALSFADSGKRTVLIEADLRKPKVSEYFEVDNGIGLTNVLAGHVAVEHVLQPWGRTRLSLIPSGPSVPNPAEALGSRMMRELVAHLRKSYDYVIIDSPPILPVTDAAVLATVADGVVFVVRDGHIKRQQIQASLQALAAVDARMLGFVMNMRPAKRGETYGTYGPYMQYGSSGDLSEAIDLSADTGLARSRSRIRTNATPTTGTDAPAPADGTPAAGGWTPSER